ncbi:MAG: transaldolase family protein [bacterium]
MAEQKMSGLEKLVAVSPGMEIWWDASPLVFDHWQKDFLARQEPQVRKWLEPQVKRLYVENDPAKSLFRGCTTNPIITKKAIDILAASWAPRVDEEIAAYPKLTAGEVGWQIYKEISRIGAGMYLPLFEQSGAREGFVSAQVDPRVLEDTRMMVRQGLELKALSPNIMVKVPGTEPGILAIFLLTAMGVPTNATVVFTVPQVLAVAEAVKAGREIGLKYGVDYSRWRSVITIMLARYEEREELAKQAQEAGFELTEELKRWCGIAIMKKAYQLLREREYLSKLLLASTRVGPVIDGKQQILHVEEAAGGNVVYTMSQNFIESILLLYKDRDFAPHIEKPIPNEVLEKLLMLPYFRAGYQENGVQPEDFINLPATIFTKNQFNKAMNDFEEFVHSRQHKAIGIK